MAAGLMVADQHQQEHDNHCRGDQAHDDHRGTGQADQVQPGCARFSASAFCLRWALPSFGRYPGGAGRRSRR